MDISAILNSDIYTWVILPLLIFTARIFDVSIGTMRVIFISRGYKFIAPLLGFFEVSIWLLAIRQIMTNLSNWQCFFAYSAGFATGTFVGMYIEEKISIGNVIMRIVTNRDASALVKELKTANHVITTTNAQSPDGKVKTVFTVVKRQDVPKIINLIKEYNPHAFYSIEDVRLVHETNMPFPRIRRRHNNLFGFYRKGK